MGGSGVVLVVAIAACAPGGITGQTPPGGPSPGASPAHLAPVASPSLAAGSPSPTPSPTPAAAGTASPSAAPTASPTPTPAPPGGLAGIITLVSGPGSGSPPIDSNPAAVVSTLAGTWSSLLADGPALQAGFWDPRGIAVASSSVVYVSDTRNNRIRRILAGQVSTWAGTATAGFADGASASARFDSPEGLALGSDGTLYVADTGNHAIREVLPDGSVTTLAAGAGSSVFQAPSALAIGPDGSVYVSDCPAGAVDRISPAGAVSVYASALDCPQGLAMGSSGTLYVAESGDSVVKSIAAGGTAAIVAGTGQPGFADGPAGSAQFDQPLGLAIDATGDLYVADGGGNRVRKITPMGSVSTLAGAGSPGDADGPGPSAELDDPAALAFDASGDLDVADAGNDLVRQLVFQAP